MQRLREELENKARQLQKTQAEAARRYIAYAFSKMVDLSSYKGYGQYQLVVAHDSSSYHSILPPGPGTLQFPRSHRELLVGMVGLVVWVGWVGWEGWVG